MSQSTENLPNFYAIIPAHVRYCKELEPNAKLLYGEITALCSKEGYCWATNKYFADIYDQDIRTVGRWLKSLKDSGFIEIEIKTGGFQTERKIWIKEIYNGRQNCPPPPTKMPSLPDENVHHINTRINTAEEVVLSKAPSVEGLRPQKITKIRMDGQKTVIDQDDVFRSAIQERRDWAPKEIFEAWKILFEYDGKVNDCYHFIAGTIDKLRNKKKFEKINPKKHKEEEKPCNTTPTTILPPPKPLDKDTLMRLFGISS